MSVHDDDDLVPSPFEQTRDGVHIRRQITPFALMAREIAELSGRVDMLALEVRSLREELCDAARTREYLRRDRERLNRRVGLWRRFARWLTCEGEPDLMPPQDRRVEHQPGPVPGWMWFVAGLTMAALGLALALIGGGR